MIATIFLFVFLVAWMAVFHRTMAHSSEGFTRLVFVSAFVFAVLGSFLLHDHSPDVVYGPDTPDARLVTIPGTTSYVQAEPGDSGWLFFRSSDRVRFASDDHGKATIQSVLASEVAVENDAPDAQHARVERTSCHHTNEMMKVIFPPLCSEEHYVLHLPAAG